MDLHDQTLADLTRLTRRVDRLSRASEVTPEALEPVSRSLQHCMQDLRQIIEQAKPSVLQLFGLAQAIEHHLDRSTRDNGLRQPNGVSPMKPMGRWTNWSRLSAWRFSALPRRRSTNAVRHAAPLAITVRLAADEDRLVIEISDDGSGQARTRKRIGGGIDNMQTRARLISARFTIASGPNNRGTVVRVVLPLAQPAGAENFEEGRHEGSDR